jgi:Fe2+ or Zn2+ uptake regulation protein
MAEPPIEGALAALKHVMRRQLLRCLNESESPRTPQSLARQMRREVTPVIYHLRALMRARMVQRVSVESRREAAEQPYESIVGDDPAVNELLAETAADDERLLPRDACRDAA